MRHHGHCRKESDMAEKVVKANITQIATKCGVSKMTVSRVLRNRPNVSEGTRRFVLEVAQKMGFMPDGCYATRAAAVGQYWILFQEACSVQDAVFSGIILSVQQELFRRGCGCSFGVLKNDYAEFLALNGILRSGGAKGVLVVGEVPTEFINTLQKNFLNLVLIDYPGGPGIQMPFNAVCTDYVHGAHQAMRHLLDLGRKRILLVCGREGHYFSTDLVRAYREALAERKMDVDPALVVHGGFHVDDGYRAVRQAMRRKVAFDAVFANDEMACGAQRALVEAGKKVPRDVSVVGFDGLPMGEAVTPALTTVMVDREKMGRLAVARLLDIESEDGSHEKFEKITLFPKLVIRDSCGGQKTNGR